MSYLSGSLLPRRLTQAPQEVPPSSLCPSPLGTGNHRSTMSDSLMSPEHTSRPLSRQSDRRPMGPRSVSPSPVPRSPDTVSELPYLSDDLASEASPRASPELTPSSSTSSLSIPSNPTPIPRSKRQQFTHYQSYQNSTEATPRASGSGSGSSSTTVAFPTAVGGGGTTNVTHGHVEPLSIKKKNSVRSSTANTSPLARKSSVRNSPLSRPVNHRMVSPKRLSPQFRKTKRGSQLSTSSINTEALEHVIQLAVSTKEDVCFDIFFFGLNLTT